MNSGPEINQREERFLDRLSRKYERSENAGQVRSYVIASVVILVLFCVSRWLPWWGLALVIVEAVGLGLFFQYKRFARFKTRILTKLWRHLQQPCE